RAAAGLLPLAARLRDGKAEGLRLAYLFRGSLDLAGDAGPELDGRPLQVAAAHRAGGLNQLAFERHEPHAAHPLAGLVERLDDECVAEHVEERVAVLLVEMT